MIANFISSYRKISDLLEELECIISITKTVSDTISQVDEKMLCDNLNYQIEVNLNLMQMIISKIWENNHIYLEEATPQKLINQ